MSDNSIASESGGALTGLRVLDLTGRMGGYCGRLLANLGAEVILIEPPEGDSLRRQGPFKNDVPHPEGSLAFAAYHTNKRGISLDLESEQGRKALLELARHADVLMVTGPVTKNMREALERTYAAMPDPKWVIAVGDCAKDGGCFKGSYACCAGVSSVLPVDLHVPGCPPNPTELLKGLLALLEAGTKRG